MLASDGSLVWSKAYGSCGVPNQCGHTFIKNECWGLAATSDGGVVLACGTGIENCNGMSGAMRSDCDADAGTPLLADTRAGAVARSAAVWQSLIVRTDADGNLQWMRTDQYRGSDDAPLGTSGWQQSSSASEYVAKCADGGLIFVNDEACAVLEEACCSCITVPPHHRSRFLSRVPSTLKVHPPVTRRRPGS